MFERLIEYEDVVIVRGQEYSIRFAVRQVENQPRIICEVIKPVYHESIHRFTYENVVVAIWMNLSELTKLIVALIRLKIFAWGKKWKQ